jgi:hypothetical protein
MPQSLLTGQLKEKLTYRFRCLYSSIVHATRVPPTSWTSRTPSSFGFSPSATRRRSPPPWPQAGRGKEFFLLCCESGSAWICIDFGRLDPDQRECSVTYILLKNVKVLNFRLFVRFCLPGSGPDLFSQSGSGLGSADQVDYGSNSDSDANNLFWHFGRYGFPVVLTLRSVRLSGRSGLKVVPAFRSFQLFSGHSGQGRQKI